jgi:integrase
MNNLKEWISLFTKRGTIKARSLSVRMYLNFIYGLTIRDADLAPYEPYAKQYLQELKKEKRSLVTDMTRFMSELSDIAPITQRNYSSGVIVWLRDNGFELTTGQRRQIFRQSPPARAITQDVPFSREDLIKVIAHAPIQLKALIYVLLSSGMRLGECTSLRLKDVDTTTDPITVYLPKHITKNRLPRITFISTEARPIFLEWLKYREKYLKLNERKNGYWKEGEDRIFPFDTSNAETMLRNALIKAELMKRDRNTNRSTLHLHTLRKFFRTQLVKGGNGNAIDMVEKLMGHEGYLTNAYVKVNEDELREFYKQAEHYLFIQQPITMKDPEAEKRISEQEKRIKELEEKLAYNEQFMSWMKEQFELKVKK